MKQEKQKKIPARVTMKPDAQDWAILKAGMDLYGARDAGQILRMALRLWGKTRSMEAGIEQVQA